MKKRFFETLWIDSHQPDETAQQLRLLFGENDLIANGFEKRMDLGNTSLQLRGVDSSARDGTVGAISVHAEAVAALSDTRGLAVLAAESEAQPVRELDSNIPGIQAIDHLVLQTNNADDCIRLFRDDLGMRLALDQTVEKWGGRMLFFREGGLTLEVIHNFEKPIKKDRFWGICYRCKQIDETHRMLSARGIEISEIREGRKPGTRVATIKSHCANIPSLLIE